jgi:hypothetical protein
MFIVGCGGAAQTGSTDSQVAGAKTENTEAVEDAGYEGSTDAGAADKIIIFQSKAEIQDQLEDCAEAFTEETGIEVEIWGTTGDDYQQQLFAMLSASDNGATNQLIDLLGMDQINAFIQEHNYGAGRLNRKMLENNGTENYTSARDCGNVLRSVYDRTYINKEASQRVEEAMRAQIARNLYKIPAGVPEGVVTANKTGELFTKNAEGVNVDVQNDAAIIFAGEHPYVLVVMTAVPGAGEAQMHEEISAISSEIYKAVCGE